MIKRHISGVFLAATAGITNARISTAPRPPRPHPPGQVLLFAC